jgi:hypothetical protein
MSVVSTTSLERTARTRLLTFVPSSASTLATLLGSTASGAGSDGKLYLNQAPDDVTGFWGVMRLIDYSQQGTDGGFMVRGALEVMLYGRPRSQQSAVERMADVVTEAWNHYSYTEATGRCLVARDVSNRATVPYQAPADRDLVAVRQLLLFMATPSFLTG